MYCIEHHVDKTFDIMVFDEQAVILNSESPGNAASHRIGIEPYAFNFG